MSDTTHRSRIAAATGIAAVAFAIAALTPAPVRGQAQRAPGRAQCAPRAPVAGPTFTFGNEGGNLRRSATKLWANGSMQAARGRRSLPNAALADSVKALARFARQSGFWTTTAPRITRPTRNPDMARHFLEVHLGCGAKSAIYPADAEPAPFHELFSRLTAIAERAAPR